MLQEISTVYKYTEVYLPVSMIVRSRMQGGFGFVPEYAGLRVVRAIEAVVYY